MQLNNPVDLARALGRPASYFPDIGRCLNTISGGLLINLLLYERPRETVDGWVTISENRITEITGLNKYEIQSAIHSLKTSGVLESEKNQYRVKWNELISLLLDYHDMRSKLIEQSKQKEFKGSVVSRMGEIFRKKFREYQNEDYILNSKDFGSLKNIKEQLEKRCEARRMDATPENIINSWTGILEHLPKYYREKGMTPAKIYSDLSIILTEIQRALKNERESKQSLTDIARG